MEPALVTGLGAVSAAGVGTAGTLETFASGRRRVGPATQFASSVAAPVCEAPWPVPADAPRMRTVDLALLAVREALAAAGLDCRPRAPRVGVCLGTTVACQLNDIDFYSRFRADPGAPLDAVRRYLRSNLSDAVAREIGAQGPRATIANACSAGTDAIGLALAWLREGLCDVAVAGGADELSRVTLAGFNALGVVSRGPCRPFDARRDGLNLGEGAGVLVLETPASARSRGRDARTAVVGYGTRADAHHLTAPRPDGSGLEAAIRDALRAAASAADSVAFVNAHGTATPANDPVEAAVLARVFGPDVRFASTKGFTGHTLGAAGGLEAVFTVLGMEAGWMPPCAGFEVPDPAMTVHPVTERTAVRGECAVSTSLAFGGNNSALVFRDLSRAAGGGA